MKPTTEDIVTALMAYRYQMAGKSEPVWLVRDAFDNWFITADRKKLQGVYARTMISKSDTNAGIEAAAANLLTRVMRDEGTGY